MSVERAHAAGLRCRPVAETVADTWAWMSTLDGPPPLRAGLPAPGLAPERERAALAECERAALAERERAARVARLRSSRG